MNGEYRSIKIIPKIFPPILPRHLSLDNHLNQIILLSENFIGIHSGIHVEALWCSGSDSRLTIRGSAVRTPPSACAPRQGILSTIASLDPGVVNGYLAGIFIP